MLSYCWWTHSIWCRVFQLLLCILSCLTQIKLFFGWVFATMICFLQVNLLNIDKTSLSAGVYRPYLPPYLQLCCRMIVLSDSTRCSEPFCSTYQSRSRPYLITLLPVCRHPTRKLVSSLPNFYFPISSFKPWTVTNLLIPQHIETSIQRKRWTPEYRTRDELSMRDFIVGCQFRVNLSRPQFFRPGLNF